MNNNNNIFVGMHIFSIEKYSSHKQKTKEYIITKIGRQYFYAHQYSKNDDGKHYSWDTKINIKTWSNDTPQFHGNTQFYDSLQAIADSEEANKLYQQIYDFFYIHKQIPLDKLKQIANILNLG